jgi:mRNA interferase RelE/StbE
MTWGIEFAGSAAKALRELDRPAAQRILTFLAERVARADDPRSLGAALKGSELRVCWKYRVGDYPIIARIDDRAVRILVVRLGQRREVYR